MTLRRFSLALLIGALALVQAPARADDAAPAVLSGADVERYREIFAAERGGRFDKAEALMGEVSDNSLKGYVLAEHYLSPHSKKVTVSELVHWLDDYRELSIADRIYRLAVKRSTKKVRRHHKTTLVAIVTNIPVPAGTPRMRGGGYEDVSLPDPPLASPAARTANDQINADIRADQPDQAMAVLQGLIGDSAIPASDVARLSQHIAQSYFTEGMDAQAYQLASQEAELQRQSAPLLDWNAGLAAFRLGQFDDAAKHFETLAQVGSVTNYIRSASAFWAARSHARAGDPTRVVTLLTVAAREEPTFYGLLAERLLGQDTETGFSDPVLDSNSLAQILQAPAARRAVALWQIGETEYIPLEVERAFSETDSHTDPAFAAFARRLDVPNVELRASETSASRGIVLTGLFPVPQYKPDGGYTIDPSLVLAIARAESKFQAGAVSNAGARGLMQVMPGTAAHLAGPAAPAHLTDPSYNMALGQRVVAQLLDLYNGNLVELCAAYNIGALKVSSWMAAREGKGDDALLFIESMRAAETRLYVKRVLTYHWMYRRRLGLDATTLTETASGAWPTYRPPAQPAPPPPPATKDGGDDEGGDDAPTTSD
jgi:peptidoglycan lytic transglycosylase